VLERAKGQRGRLGLAFAPLVSGAPHEILATVHAAGEDEQQALARADAMLAWRLPKAMATRAPKLSGYGDLLAKFPSKG